MNEVEVENGDIYSHVPMGQKRQNIANGFTAGIRSENSLFDILQIITQPVSSELFEPQILNTRNHSAMTPLTWGTEAWNQSHCERTKEVKM